MASAGEGADLLLDPRVDSTLSSVSAISLTRTTEKEGIFVDEGFCDIEDPNFGDAADRQAKTPTPGQICITWITCFGPFVI